MKRTSLGALLMLAACALSFGQRYKVLYSFTGAQAGDGANPLAELVRDSNGNLYGTTQFGGVGSGCGSLGCGTVFELIPNSDGTWTESILYSFCIDHVNELCLDGGEPKAGLVVDSKGNLYGTTYFGGTNLCAFVSASCGNVFELSPPSLPGGQWTETVLYNFCSTFSNGVCLDGALPIARLVADASGHLYGTTSMGGSGHYTNAQGGGTVFELSHGANGWTERVLYNFCSLGQGNFCPDGTQPMAGVTFDRLANLYGTTRNGGSKNAQGEGTVFKLTPGAHRWTETVLKTGMSVGAGAPLGTVSLDQLGNLYSTFSQGGAGAGGVFRLTPHSGAKAFMFSGPDGGTPTAGVLIESAHPALYGTGSQGGVNFSGAVFKIVAPSQETVLYSFCSEANCADGGAPVASLIEDESGNLYGTASMGGINNQGVVFEIVQSLPKQKASQRPPIWHSILPSRSK